MGTNKRVIVTGGAGFIGSAVVRRLLREPDIDVVVLDAFTYAASPATLAGYASPRLRIECCDIRDRARVEALVRDCDPDAIMHLAAESHVDRSIDGPALFIETNIVGTSVMLDAALRHWRSLGAERAAAFRFHHISTDEVFGALGDTGAFTEDTRYDPRSPYSASKAASDHLVRAWYHTYGLPVVLSNCSNNYGPYHFPEKLIPLTIIKALAGEMLPVYGTGANVRDWLHVDDHAEALWTIVSRGRPGESYNVGARSERRNIDVVRGLCAALDELAPRGDGRPHDSAIRFVTDRPGHDFRYAIDPAKIETELGWRPRQSFESGLRHTVMWYLENQSWWEPLRAGQYAGERLGLANTVKQETHAS